MSAPILSHGLVLEPICCKYCAHHTDFITYIQFDLELHLYETHNIRSDLTMKDALDSGKRLGATSDKDSIEKLDLEYSKYLEKQKTSIDRKSIPATAYEGNIMEGVRPWSQRTKNSFMSVVSVDEFFKDDPDTQYSTRNHSLEQSPCYPIIGAKSAGRNILYYCEICQPEFANDSVVASIHLSSIEHHIKFKDPDRHRAEILARLVLPCW